MSWTAKLSGIAIGLPYWICLLFTRRMTAMNSEPGTQSKSRWSVRPAIVVGMINLMLWGIAIYPIGFTTHALLTQESCDAAMGAGILGTVMLGAGIPLLLVSVILGMKTKGLPHMLRTLIIASPAMAVLLGAIFLLAAT